MILSKKNFLQNVEKSFSTTLFRQAYPIVKNAVISEPLTFFLDASHPGLRGFASCYRRSWAKEKMFSSLGKTSTRLLSTQTRFPLRKYLTFLSSFRHTHVFPNTMSKKHC